MKTLINIFMSAFFVIVLVFANVSFVLADQGADADQNKKPVLGDLEKAKLVIPEVSIPLVDENGNPLRMDRVGSTNVYDTGYINGYHLSTSEITEDDISVQGGIKIYGESWADQDSEWREDANFAFCATQMTDPPGTQYFWGESIHYWNTEGWGPSNAQTSNDCES